MMDKDAQSVTQADREAAAALLGGASPDGLLEGRQDSLSLVQAFARHRLASQPTSAEDAWRPIETAPKDGTAVLAILTDSDLPHTARYRDGAWMIAWDGFDLSGSDDEPTHWMPLPAAPGTASRPTPDTQTAAIGAEAMREALENCRDQFQFYADEHSRANKPAKAATNQRFADMCMSILTQPVAAPQAEMAGGEVYLICKGGAYYRPNAQGYTRNKSEAGRYTLAEAISHSHPNGPDGPRDGITYELAPPQPEGCTVADALRDLMNAVANASRCDDALVDRAYRRAEAALQPEKTK